MFRDERFYAYIVDRTSRSRSRIHRIVIHKRWLKTLVCVTAALICVASYGIYSFTQVAKFRLEQENELLRLENEKQRRQLDNLKNRVEAVEDASRRLSEMSGVSQVEEETILHGAGGPFEEMSVEAIAAIEQRAAQLEKTLEAYESIMRQRARIPSVWPVEGEITDGFGMRRNPFDAESIAEFHAGQDIAAPSGTPVVAAGSGKITFAGVQNGYGQLVIIDHGNGLTTRYGHLSRIDVAEGQEIERGETLGSVGSTGRSTGPHLHYEVRINDSAVNPRRYLPDTKS